VQWFITSFITHRQPRGLSVGMFQSREYWSLLTAAAADVAYDKALDLAKKTVDELTSDVSGKWTFDGLSELLIVGEPPEDHSELMWTQQELSPCQLDNYVKAKDKLSVFKAERGPWPASAWYVCELVLVEVHDAGSSHGDSILVWTNSHLIRETDTESAYGYAVELGTKEASDSGVHRCDGDNAHWSFRGLRDLIETIGPPSDGGVLWFEEFNSSLEHLNNLISPRSKLGVFEWEAQQHLSGA
jgi:hypothetical protein